MGHTPDCELGTSTIDAQMAQSGQSPLLSWTVAASFTARSAIRNDDFWDFSAVANGYGERRVSSEADTNLLGSANGGDLKFAS
jgi:hypothetical protein